MIAKHFLFAAATLSLAIGSAHADVGARQPKPAVQQNAACPAVAPAAQTDAANRPPMTNEVSPINDVRRGERQYDPPNPMAGGGG